MYRQAVLENRITHCQATSFQRFGRSLQNEPYPMPFNYAIKLAGVSTPALIVAAPMTFAQTATDVQGGQVVVER